MIFKTKIRVLAAIAVLALLFFAMFFYVFDNYVFRSFPEISFIYSNDDVLTSKKRFTSGRVGPFDFSFDIKSNIFNLKKHKSSCKYFENEPSSRILSVYDIDIEQIEQSRDRFVFQCTGYFANVIYVLQVNQNRITSIEMSSSAVG
jgi:hypothetical protein